MKLNEKPAEPPQLIRATHLHSSQPQVPAHLDFTEQAFLAKQLSGTQIKLSINLPTVY
jgi:hypothetical protein